MNKLCIVELVWLAGMLVSPVFGVGMKEVPPVRDVEYAASPRDPFVAASVSQTLLGAVGERDLSKIAPPIESYTGALESLIRQANKINGVAISGGMGMSIVNGRIVKPGGTISIAVPDELGKRLMATSRYFGLGLEPQIEAKYLQFKVSRISKTGLYLTLRGMRTELFLGYRKNLSPSLP